MAQTNILDIYTNIILNYMNRDENILNKKSHFIV